MTHKSGKIWGETVTVLSNPAVELHRISAKAGYRCSLHKHLHKWNGFYVERGTLEIHVVKSKYNLTDVTILNAGEFTTVPPGEKHFFLCKKDCIAFEVYYPELLTTEDIIREDVGKRVKKK